MKFCAMFCRPKPMPTASDRGRGEQRVEPEAHRVDGPDEADRGHRVANDLRDRELHALRGAARAEHAAHREREQIGDGERDEDDRRADEERPGRDRRPGQLEQLAVEKLLEVVGHAPSATERSLDERDAVLPPEELSPVHDPCRRAEDPAVDRALRRVHELLLDLR